GEFQGDQSAEGDAQESGTLQTMPIDKLRQIRDEVLHPKLPPQREAIILAPKLISQDTEMCRQEPGQWTKQSEAARQSGNDHEWWSFAPFGVFGCIVP